MKTKVLRRKKNMGRFSVEFQISNYVDIGMARRGLLPPDKVRRQTITGVVDPGAVKLVLPEAVVKELGLDLSRKIQVRYADRRTSKRWQAEGAYLELLGRQGFFDAIVEPNRKTALIGAIVLEDLDLLVDRTRQCLIPRDSRGPIYEVE
jgi:hypothetical protein